MLDLENVGGILTRADLEAAMAPVQIALDGLRGTAPRNGLATTGGLASLAALGTASQTAGSSGSYAGTSTSQSSFARFA